MTKGQSHDRPFHHKRNIIEAMPNERANGWITFLWGEAMEYIAEAMILGTSLAQFSQWPRVLYCTEEVIKKALGDILRTVWEIEIITHLDIQEI